MSKNWSPKYNSVDHMGNIYTMIVGMGTISKDWYCEQFCAYCMWMRQLTRYRAGNMKVTSLPLRLFQYSVIYRLSYLCPALILFTSSLTRCHNYVDVSFTEKCKICLKIISTTLHSFIGHIYLYGKIPLLFLPLFPVHHHRIVQIGVRQPNAVVGQNCRVDAARNYKW